MGGTKKPDWFDDIPRKRFVEKCIYFGLGSGYLAAVAVSYLLAAWDIGEARTAQFMIVFMPPFLFMFHGVKHLMATLSITASWILPLALAPGLSRTARFLTTCGLSAMMSIGLATYLSLTLPPRTASPDSLCASNLEQIYLGLMMYAADSGSLPELSDKAGHLAMRLDDNFPGAKYFTDYDPFLCTARAWYEEFIEPTPPTTYSDDRSYFYLGYVVPDQETLERFASLYTEQIAAGERFEDDLGGDGEDSKAVQRLTILNLIPAGTPNLHDIPILIERYPNAHRIKGGWIAYTSGRVQWINWGERWPMTAEAMEILHSLEAFDS